MMRDLFGRRGVGDALAQRRRDRVAQRHMRHAARAEEAGLPRKGAVDDLVDEHEQAGIIFAPIGAAGGDGDEVGDAGALQRIDVRAVVDARWGEAMPLPVAREKHAFGPAHAPEPQRVRGLAPGTDDALFPDVGQAVERVDAGTANHAYDGFAHGWPPQPLPAETAAAAPCPSGNVVMALRRIHDAHSIGATKNPRLAARVSQASGKAVKPSARPPRRASW